MELSYIKRKIIDSWEEKHRRLQNIHLRLGTQLEWTESPRLCPQVPKLDHPEMWPALITPCNRGKVYRKFTPVSSGLELRTRFWKIKTWPEPKGTHVLKDAFLATWANWTRDWAWTFRNSITESRHRSPRRTPSLTSRSVTYMTSSEWATRSLANPRSISEQISP